MVVIGIEDDLHIIRADVRIPPRSLVRTPRELESSNIRAPTYRRVVEGEAHLGALRGRQARRIALVQRLALAQSRGTGAICQMGSSSSVRAEGPLERHRPHLRRGHGVDVLAIKEGAHSTARRTVSLGRWSRGLGLQAWTRPRKEKVAPLTGALQSPSLDMWQPMTTTRTVCPPAPTPAAPPNHLPERIRMLTDISENLWWSWQLDALSCSTASTGACGNHPAQRRAVSAAGLPRPSRGARPRSHIARALRSRGAAVRAAYAEERELVCRPLSRAAQPVDCIFSAEFALHRLLPIYSGGLGRARGRPLQEASDWASR